MSHSGNSSSRRIKSLQKLHGGDGGTGEQLYNPSVFRYKCYGYLNLNSEDKGSYGACRGYQSRMERVANMVPDTREGAIKKFLEASNDLGTYVDTDDNSSDQKVKEIYTARTMIYKEDLDDAVNNKIQPVKPSSPLSEDELINKTEWSCWGSTSVHYLVLDPIRKARRMPKQKQQQTSLKKAPASTDVDAASEAQKEKADGLFDALTQQLRNYDKNLDQQFDRNNSNNKKKKAGDDDADGSSSGSSNNESSDKENSFGDGRKKQRRNSAREVIEAFAKKQNEKLVVAKVGGNNNNVSAITPENIGVSIRKIDSSVGHFTVTDIGSIRICVETSGSLIGDSSNNNKSNNSRNPFDRSTNSQQLANTNNSTNGGQDHQQGNNNNNNGVKSDGEAKEPRTAAEELKKFYDFTIKVGHQFQYNCKEIREAVRDDYPMRTYRFGTKVVNRFQKTSEQTYTYMGKILNSWWKSM